MDENSKLRESTRGTYQMTNRTIFHLCGKALEEIKSKWTHRLRLRVANEKGERVANAKLNLKLEHKKQNTKRENNKEAIEGNIKALHHNRRCNKSPELRSVLSIMRTFCANCIVPFHNRAYALYS